MATREETLLRTVVELTDNLVDDFDVVELLSLLSHRCVELLDLVAAGIVLADADGQLRLMASSSEAMRIVELFEVQADEGPCMDCFATGATIAEPDLARAGERWPRFAPEAVEAGFRAAHAVPLRLRRTTMGALNLFRADVGPLGGPDLLVAQALADVATIAILQQRISAEAQTLNEQLARALNSRVAIEQAKGVLAEQGDLTMDVAFERLRGHSRSTNTRLALVAQAVVDGDLSLATLTPSAEPS